MVDMEGFCILVCLTNALNIFITKTFLKKKKEGKPSIGNYGVHKYLLNYPGLKANEKGEGIFFFLLHTSKCNPGEDG